jgi:hypothetical protein
VIALQPVAPDEPDAATFEQIYADHHRDVVRYVALMRRDQADRPPTERPRGR